jgi:hypothetical protein
MPETTSIDSAMLSRLLDAATRSRTGTALPAIALGLSITAVCLSGAAVWLAFDRPAAPAQLAAPAAASATGLVPQAFAAAPPPGIAPLATPDAGQGGVRIAQSGNGSIYAFDPATGLAFLFDANRAGPTPVETAAIPADIRTRLLSGPAAPVAIDTAALDAQTAEARAALAAQATDQRRPPVNQLLGDAAITGEIVAALEQAQGIVRPGADGGAEPAVYAFFDPQCPYCHQAFAGLDGTIPVKWMPVSTLGPRGDRLHAYIMAEVAVQEDTLDSGDITRSATFGPDEERGARLAEIMTGDTVPPEAALSEGQEFVLAENAELFRLLSRGAEEMRAVPSFFVRGPDGTAVWLRGYDEATPGLIADIMAGEDRG